MLPFTIPSKMQKPWENASFTVMHQSWENCAIVTQALDKRKLRMTNWKALIQFKLLQHLAYTEVKKYCNISSHFWMTKKFWYTKSKTQFAHWLIYSISTRKKPINSHLFLLFECATYLKNILSFLRLHHCAKKVEITLYLKVSFWHNLSNPKIVC